ncbi:MAG: hypothetical protein H0V12_05045 [Chloroflexi bacterium]|nr:hypothetical protein [Chloroflexota bacterium]
MPLVDLIVLILFALLVLAGTARAPTVWAGKSGYMSPALEVVLPTALSRGTVRAYAVLIGTGWVMIATLAASYTVCPAMQPEATTSCDHLLALFGLLIFGGFALAIAIALINRPKRLVPPSMRAQDGALREWRASLARSIRRE